MKQALIFLSLTFLFVFPLHARKYKAPKWKEGNFVSASGIRAQIIKSGKGPKPRLGDNAVVFYTRYDQQTKMPLPDTLLDRKKGYAFPLETEANNLVKAILMLAKGGEGYFILPTGAFKADGITPDSAFFFLRVKSITPGANPEQVSGQQNTNKDSVALEIKDPSLQNYGDTLFTTMKLVEVQKIVPCGMMMVLNVFRFRVTWFDNGVQHKDIYLYVQCPESYGKDYFVAGATYVVTAIPLLENHKKSKQVFNPYTASQEKLEAYYCLRITKK